MSRPLRPKVFAGGSRNGLYASRSASLSPSWGSRPPDMVISPVSGIYTLRGEYVPLVVGYGEREVGGMEIREKGRGLLLKLEMVVGEGRDSWAES